MLFWEFLVRIASLLAYSHKHQHHAPLVQLTPNTRNKKKERNSRFSLQYPEPRVEVRSTRANTTIAQTFRGRAIDTLMFAQPPIKVSTAATGEVLVARIKRSFEGDVCVRQVYLLMSTNIALRHAVPLATNTTLKTKKREKLSFLSAVPRAGVEPAQG